MKTFREKLAELPEERRSIIETEGQQLLQEYMTLQEIRKAIGLTQKEIAEAMDIEQNHVSRLERRTDMKLSTLKEFIEALGGKLKVSIEIPGKEPISISGLVGLEKDESQHIASA